MKFLAKLFSCGGRKSARADIYQIEPKLHTACRSTDPKNLKSYQVSRNKAKAGDKNENKKSNDDDELYVRNFFFYFDFKFNFSKIISRGRIFPIITCRGIVNGLIMHQLNLHLTKS